MSAPGRRTQIGRVIRDVRLSDTGLVPDDGDDEPMVLHDLQHPPPKRPRNHWATVVEAGLVLTLGLAIWSAWMLYKAQMAEQATPACQVAQQG